MPVRFELHPPPALPLSHWVQRQQEAAANEYRPRVPTRGGRTSTWGWLMAISAECAALYLAESNVWCFFDVLNSLLNLLKTSSCSDESFYEENKLSIKCEETEYHIPYTKRNIVFFFINFMGFEQPYKHFFNKNSRNILHGQWFLFFLRITANYLPFFNDIK